MQKTFFISDLHFGHHKIIEYVRPQFTDAKHMNTTIINNWNRIIKNDYYVFVLGDVSMYPKAMTMEIVQQLNGRKILIMGNHDRGKSTKYWKEIGFEDVSKYPIIFDEFYICSHEPIPIKIDNYSPYYNIHGHMHEKQMEKFSYFNVSVECINYTPIDFDKIKETIKEREQKL